MMSLLPPVDWVNDAEAWSTKVVELFSRYPLPVMTKAAHTIPERSSRPSIALVAQVLAEISEPFEREHERALMAQRAAESRLLAPPREKRTPDEQARVDAQVEAARAKLGIPEGVRGNGFIPRPSDSAAYKSAPIRDDGRHGDRIAADLDRRKQINTQRTDEMPI